MSGTTTRKRSRSLDSADERDSKEVGSSLCTLIDFECHLTHTISLRTTPGSPSVGRLKTHVPHHRLPRPASKISRMTFQRTRRFKTRAQRHWLPRPASKTSRMTCQRTRRFKTRAHRHWLPRPASKISRMTFQRTRRFKTRAHRRRLPRLASKISWTRFKMHGRHSTIVVSSLSSDSCWNLLWTVKRPTS